MDQEWVRAAIEEVEQDQELPPLRPPCGAHREIVKRHPSVPGCLNLVAIPPILERAAAQVEHSSEMMLLDLVAKLGFRLGRAIEQSRHDLGEISEEHRITKCDKQSRKRCNEQAANDPPSS